MGLLGALVVTVSEPAGTGPSAVGVTVIEMEQLELAATMAPHVVEDTAYGAGTATEVIVTGVSW